MLEPGETVQSQYAASPVMRALIESARLRIAPDADIELFYQNIFDISTAQGVGLDIWGRILGIGRTIEFTSLNEFFGFFEADYDSFDVSPFFSGDGVTQRYELADEAYRELLLWKAMANIATADAAALNRLLSALFPGQDIVVHEAGVMALELYIFFPLEPYQRSILDNYGLIAKGAGVGLKWVEIPYPVFGFAEAGYEPFDDSPFWNGTY